MNSEALRGSTKVDAGGHMPHFGDTERFDEPMLAGLLFSAIALIVIALIALRRKHR